MSEEEEKTLHYVAGFIVSSMKRKYDKILEENPKHISASNALIFLKSVKNVGGEKIQKQFLKEFFKKVDRPDQHGKINTTKCRIL